MAPLGRDSDSEVLLPRTLASTQQPASRLRSSPQLHQPGKDPSSQNLNVQQAPQSELGQILEVVQ